MVGVKGFLAGVILVGGGMEGGRGEARVGK